MNTRKTYISFFVILSLIIVCLLCYKYFISEKPSGLRTSEEVLQEIESKKTLETKHFQEPIIDKPKEEIAYENNSTELVTEEPKDVFVSFEEVEEPYDYDKAEMEDLLRNTVITDGGKFFQTDYDSFTKPRDGDTFSISIDGLEYEGIVNNFKYDGSGGTDYYSFWLDFSSNTRKPDARFSLSGGIIKGEIIDYNNKETNGYMIRYANGVGLYMGTREYNKKMSKVISFY